jgi:uncharacterized coiled-coil DUF342 family protein
MKTFEEIYNKSKLEESFDNEIDMLQQQYRREMIHANQTNGSYKKADDIHFKIRQLEKLRSGEKETRLPTKAEMSDYNKYELWRYDD